MKVKNLTGVSLTFPGGQVAGPGREIFISDAEWAQIQFDDVVAGWLAAGALELNGAAIPAMVGRYGKIIVLENEAQWTALTPKDPLTLYVWPTT